MGIELLSKYPVALALAFSRLSIDDRNACWSACQLFRSVLEKFDYQTVLWPPQVFRTMHVDNLRFPCIRNALSRLFANAHRNIAELPERHTSAALSLHSYGSLLLSCEGSEKCPSEVLIWKKKNNSYCLSQKLGQFFGKWLIYQFRTTCTVQGDWLIRSALDCKENREFFVKVDVWKLNEETAKAKELFATKIPYIFPNGVFSSSFDCMPALRDKDTLYIPFPFTPEVQVAVIDEAPCLTKKIDLSPTIRSRISALDTCGDELVVHTWDKSVFISRTDSARVEEGGKRILHSDNGWTVIHDTGFKILRNNRVHRIINVPADFDNRKWSPRTHLGMHHFLLGYGKVCHLYTLWDLNENGKPNRTITLPDDVDTDIIAVYMHEENVILSTADGKIWQA